MANRERLRILKEEGIDAWNAWRRQVGEIWIDLGRADLFEADLCGANLSGVDLGEANLFGANLGGADLTRADLSEADLNRADLSGTDLSEADLRRANLNGADLREAYLDGATVAGTVFANVDLGLCKALDAIRHWGPSVIDIGTVESFGSLPLSFLRGVGLPDRLIEYLPSMLGQAIQHYSCFISYSSKDDAFVSRLHADLQAKGVRCWFAPHDMKIGANIRDTIDDAIRLRDKLLLVLSEASIDSTWVEGEVEKAFEEERQRSGVVLFPVRLDDAVLTTPKAWAGHLRRSRHIGDFRAWKDHDAYQHTLARLLRDLRVEAADAASG